jgi:hypothetical protein
MQTKGSLLAETIHLLATANRIYIVIRALLNVINHVKSIYFLCIPEYICLQLRNRLVVELVVNGIGWNIDNEQI